MTFASRVCRKYVRMNTTGPRDPCRQPASNPSRGLGIVKYSNSVTARTGMNNAAAARLRARVVTAGYVPVV